MKEIRDMCYEGIKTVGGKRGWLWPLYSQWSELASEEVTVEPNDLKDEKTPSCGKILEEGILM